MMKAKILISLMQVRSGQEASDNQIGYMIGGIIALLVLGYLVYILLHPQKF